MKIMGSFRITLPQLLAALSKWQLVTDENVSSRILNLRDKILNNQSKEELVLEYDGFDRAIQTLCTYYLAEADRTNPDLGPN